MAAELLARTTVYKGRIFQLEIDAVRLPTGHTIDMEIVRHPGSVVLLPIPSPGTIILIRQYRYTIDRWIWELPADEEMIYYRCEVLRPPAPDSTAKKDDDEEIEPRTFTLEEARALIASGEIVDLKTLAGLSLL
jgi:hypothetical protein